MFFDLPNGKKLKQNTRESQEIALLLMTYSVCSNVVLTLHR